MRGDLRDRCRQCSPKAIGSTSGNSPHKDRREMGVGGWVGEHPPRGKVEEHWMGDHGGETRKLANI